MMMTRREFMRRVALSSLAVSAWGCGSTSNETTTFVGTPRDGVLPAVDLAVVGGGMAGLYSAWRVLTAARQGYTGLGSPPRVAVFEASPRIGGRLYSLPTEGIPQIPTEIGGMRILDTHPLVNNLVNQLRLQLLPFPSGGENNLYFVRGTRFTDGELADGFPIPYDLAPRERTLNPGDLLLMAITDILPDAEELTRSQWLQVKQTLTYQGVPLYDQIYRDVLRSRLSQGGYDFLYDGLGYLADFNNLNAAEMFQNAAEFGGSYFRVVGGYQTMPLRLAQEVSGLGGQVTLEMPLRHIGATADGYELRFATGQRVQARRVILAMPPAALEQLEPDSLPLRVGTFGVDLQAVQPQRASRLFLAFREPWWKTRLGIANGFSRTDLPLRQCVYFGTEGEQPGGQAGNTNSLLLATFSEADAGAYWAEFLERPSEPYPGAGVPASLAAPRPLVEEALRQLSLVHGFEVPRPYWAAFIDWSLDHTVAAYHFWRPRFKSWEVIPRVGTPLPGLYVAGEAFSTNQAWVEGALDNAEETLQNELGLAPPPGVTPAYVPANYKVAVGV